MDLQNALLKLKENHLDGGIFDGDEAWIIVSAPIIPSLKAQLGSDVKAVDRFSIRPTGDSWSLVILGPGMIDVTISTKSNLEELVSTALDIYSHPEETTGMNKVEQAVENIKKGGLLADWGGYSRVILGGTHLVNADKNRAFGNMFAIFLHSTIWVGILIKTDRTSSLIAYSRSLSEVASAIIEHFKAVID